MNAQVQRLQSEIKNPGTAVLVCLLLGFHYIYLGKVGKQLLFWCTFGGVGIWWLIDIFTIHGRVKRYNDRIYDKIEIAEHRARS